MTTLGSHDLAARLQDARRDAMALSGRAAAPVLRRASLPACASCPDCRPGEDWARLHDYLIQNSVPARHRCCSSCADAQERLT